MSIRKVYSVLCACILISLLVAGFSDVRAVNDPPVAVALAPFSGCGPNACEEPKRNELDSEATTLAFDKELGMPTGFFTENEGQLQTSDVRFYSPSGNPLAGFADSAVLLKLVTYADSAPPDSLARRDSPLPNSEMPRAKMALVRITFEGANTVQPQGLGELPHRSNFFLGNDPAKWRTDVPNYEEIVYENIYDGIDLAYRMEEGKLKYEFIVHPGANPSRIVMSYENVEGLVVDGGDLVLNTAAGEIRDTSPYSYQRPGEEVRCSFVLYGSRSSGLDCEKWDSSKRLVIDPTVVVDYSTYLGNYGTEDAWGIDVDSNGNAYVTGYTDSDDFPLENPFDDLFEPDSEAFVTKLNPDGSALVYSTYLGGSGDDYGRGIAVDSNGNAYVTGHTSSNDFPTKNPIYPDNPLGDAFVTKLNAAGNELVYSTYLGGDGSDGGWDIDVDSNGNAYVTGHTSSNDFPTQNPLYLYQEWADAFVTKLNAAGSGLVYSTYLGGVDHDRGISIASDSYGNAHVTGITQSDDFPLQNPLYSILRGGDDAFVTKINADGSALVYSTYLGGNGQDSGWGIDADSDGNAYVTTWSGSSDFPTTTGAWSEGPINPMEDDWDITVTKLNADGTALEYSTYFGSPDTDGPYSIAVDSDGYAYVTGRTYSIDFPNDNAPYPDSAGGQDAIAFKLNPDGRGYEYSTYLGGGSRDEGHSIAVDPDGSAYVTGYTTSGPPKPYPTTENAWDTQFHGLSEAFVTKIRVNKPPVAVALPKLQTVVLGDPAVFIGSDSYDPDGVVVTYFWQFGDSLDSYEMDPQHTYGGVGVYLVMLTVTDDDGDSGQDTAVAIVVYPPEESSIYGYKYDDINSNGGWDGTGGGGYHEPGVSLWAVSLYYYSAYELDWIFVSVVLTDANGRFDFGPLPQGLYMVVESLNPNWIPTGCWTDQGICEDFDGNPVRTHAKVTLPASTQAVVYFGNHYLGGPHEPSYVVSVGVGGSESYQVQHLQEFEVTVEISNSGDLESHLKFLRFQAAIEDNTVVLFADAFTHPASYEVYLHTGELMWSGTVLGVYTQELHAGLGGGIYDMMSWTLPSEVVLEGELPTGEKGLVVFRFSLVAVGYPPSTTKVQFFIESTEDHHPTTAPTLPQITDKANIWTNYTDGRWFPAHNSFDPFDSAYASSHKWQSNCWHKDKWIEKVTTQGYAHIDISVEIVP